MRIWTIRKHERWVFKWLHSTSLHRIFDVTSWFVVDGKTLSWIVHQTLVPLHSSNNGPRSVVKALKTVLYWWNINGVCSITFWKTIFYRALHVGSLKFPSGLLKDLAHFVRMLLLQWIIRMRPVLIHKVYTPFTPNQIKNIQNSLAFYWKVCPNFI